MLRRNNSNIIRNNNIKQLYCSPQPNLYVNNSVDNINKKGFTNTIHL